MQFKTTFSPNPSEFKITHSDSLFFIGSCFSSNIGNQMKALGFQTQINPTGTLFNPISVRHFFENLRLNNEEEYIFKHQEVYKSWEHGHLYYSENKDDLIVKIKENKLKSLDFIKNCKYIFITYGTAWVYKYQNKTVVNCHKIAQKEFEKTILSVSEIEQEIRKTKQCIAKINSRAKVVFTLSPVRHLKDGFVENMHAKSNLRAALGMLLKEFYFPSYEIQLDDLRDYRFYKEDLLHPNAMAVKYIFSIFKATYFNKETTKICDSILKIKRGLAHKSTNTNSLEHQKFQDYLQKQIALLPLSIQGLFNDYFK